MERDANEKMFVTLRFFSSRVPDRRRDHPHHCHDCDSKSTAILAGGERVRGGLDPTRIFLHGLDCFHESA
jgi:hypothetical protein